MKPARAFGIAAFAFIATALASAARADLLFIDMNDSQEEIKSATEIAGKRNPKEDVIVVPKNKMPKTLRAEIDKEMKELKAKVATLRQQGAAGKDTTKLAADVKQLADKIEQQKAPYNFSMAELEAKLDEMKKNGKKVTSVVASGHSEGAGISGRLGSIEFPELAGVLKKHGANTDVRAMYLFGCYTVTPMTVKRWQNKDDFPSLQFMAGYRLKGFANTNDHSMGYLEQMMKDEPELLKHVDDKKMHKYLKGLTYGNYQPALLINNCYYSSESPAGVPISQLKNSCDQGLQANLRAEWARTYNPYFLAEAADHADPPTADHNELRTFYNNVQSNEDCVASAKGGRGDIPELDQIRNLVLFKNLRQNFAAKYQDDIKKLNAKLAKLKNAPKECSQVPDLGGNAMTRKKVLAAVSNLSACLKANPEDVNDEQTDTMRARMEAMLRDLKCVPRDLILDFAESTRSAKPEDIPGCQTTLSPKVFDFEAGQ